MSEQMYNLVVLAVEIFMVVMVFGLSFYLLRRDIAGGMRIFYGTMKERNRVRMKDSPEKLSAYESMVEKMVAQGITYRMGDNFTPFDYMCFRIAISLGIGILVMVLFGPVYAVFGFLGGMLFIPYYFKHEDDYDNGEMLNDIGQMYGIIAVQVKNGVHLSKAVYECYLGVQQPRLKKALMELATDIESFSSVEEAAVRFRKKFNNKHIDTFAKTLEQAESTGSSVQLFEDVASNIKSINRALAIRTEQQVELKGFLFQTLIFAGIFVFVIYVVIIMMSSVTGML